MARGPVDFPGEAPYTTFHHTNHTKEVGRRGGPLEKARGGFAQALRAEEEDRPASMEDEALPFQMIPGQSEEPEMDYTAALKELFGGD